MTKEQVKDELLSILKRHNASFEMHFADQSIYEKPLTGSPFYLRGIELVEVFFEFEKTLSIQIDVDMAEPYALATIKGFVDIAMQTIQSKKTKGGSNEIFQKKKTQHS